MGSRVYATWNPNAHDSGLLLDQGNLVITTAQNALSTARKALGTLPKASSPGYFESAFWSVPQVSLGSNVAIGVALPDSPLNQAMGADAGSCGYYPATGVVLYNNATLITLDPIPERTTIGLDLVFSGGHAYMMILVHNAWLYSADLGTGGSFWVPGATLGGGNAGETSLFSNFGQRGFDYAQFETPT